MKQTAFLRALPVSRTPNRNLNPSHIASLHSRPRSAPFDVPSCSLTHHFRNVVFTSAAIGLTLLPLRTIASPLHTTNIHDAPVLVTSASSGRFSSSLAVVGVAKAPIHDYSMTYEYIGASPSTDPIDEARRELSLATRLITAVLLGAIVGVERSATTLNLGVRSVTLISLSSAVASVVIAGMDVMPPAFLAFPSLGVMLVSAFTGLCVYTAAKLRRPRPPHIGAMSWIVSLSVAMGTACGTGLSLATVISCLAAVYVMRRKYTSPLLPRRVPVIARNMSAEMMDSRERYLEVARSSSEPYSASRRSDGVDG